MTLQRSLYIAREIVLTVDEVVRAAARPLWCHLRRRHTPDLDWMHQSTRSVGLCQRCGWTVETVER